MLSGRRSLTVTVLLQSCRTDGQLHSCLQRSSRDDFRQAVAQALQVSVNRTHLPVTALECLCHSALRALQAARNNFPAVLHRCSVRAWTSRRLRARPSQRR